MINAYDFDGTIYDGDSSVDFFLYSLKRKPSNIILIPIQLWGVLLYLFRIKNKDYMKEKLFSFVKRIDVDIYVKDFWKTHKKKIKEFYLKQKKSTDIIISASPEFLLKPLEKDYNFKVIGTKVDKNTGRFLSKNCHDYEKIKRYEKYTNKKHNINNFYSDSFKSDKAMLEYAENAYLVKKNKVELINVHEYEKKKNKKKLILIIISILLLSLMISNYIVRAKENKQIWDQKLNKDENIVFLGDSLIEFYRTEYFYEDLPIINSGKAGITSVELMDTLKERVYDYNPTKVFILVGTNDINDKDLNNDDIPNNIEKMIKDIRKNRPKAILYVLSIYPINSSDDKKINKDNVLPRDNKEIKRINTMIEKMCEKDKVTYIDMYSKLIEKNGSLNIDYTTDGLHLSDIGYFKVTKELLPYIID